MWKFTKMKINLTWHASRFSSWEFKGTLFSNFSYLPFEFFCKLPVINKEDQSRVHDLFPCFYSL